MYLTADPCQPFKVLDRMTNSDFAFEPRKAEMLRLTSRSGLRKHYVNRMVELMVLDDSKHHLRFLLHLGVFSSKAH